VELEETRGDKGSSLLGRQERNGPDTREKRVKGEDTANRKGKGENCPGGVGGRGSESAGLKEWERNVVS